jgi:hypothetical protein
MSGILQQGYSMGYVFAACANLGVGGGTDTWKTVFWIAGESTIPSDTVRRSLTIRRAQPVSLLQLVSYASASPSRSPSSKPRKPGSEQ